MYLLFIAYINSDLLIYMIPIKLVFEDEAITYRYAKAVTMNDIINYALTTFELDRKKAYQLLYQSPLMGLKPILDDSTLNILLNTMPKKVLFLQRNLSVEIHEETKSSQFDKLPTTPKKLEDGKIKCNMINSGNI